MLWYDLATNLIIEEKWLRWTQEDYNGFKGQLFNVLEGNKELQALTE